MSNIKIKTYQEMLTYKTFEERLKYLSCLSNIGETTFGIERYLNQIFYKSKEWKKIRNEIILRDEACDMAMSGYDIYDHIIIHHINPITIYDIEQHTDFLINPKYLVCVSYNTHNIIHFGNTKSLAANSIITRKPNDTKLW